MYQTFEFPPNSSFLAIPSFFEPKFDLEYVGEGNEKSNNIIRVDGKGEKEQISQ